MAEHPSTLRDASIDLGMDTAHLPGRDVLDRATHRLLSTRSNWAGLRHMAGHLGALVMTTALIYAARHHGLWLVPAMFLHGCLLVLLFAPMHECVHRTAFRSRLLNQVIGWITGALAFYNSDYYRRYHHWHHRFTQDPEYDPELTTPKPRTVGAYLLRMSGLLFWSDKIRDMSVVSCGQLAHLPFIPIAARGTVIWSMRIQVALYLLAMGSAVWWQSPVVLFYWFFPLLLGQPLLRALTFAEHTGCREEPNGLTNTRTTLTSWPIRFFMWNMPYHAEHHLYPSIPFHALPQAHVAIRNRIANLDNGYIRVHRKLVHSLRHDTDETARV